MKERVETRGRKGDLLPPGEGGGLSLARAMPPFFGLGGGRGGRGGWLNEIEKEGFPFLKVELNLAWGGGGKGRISEIRFLGGGGGGGGGFWGGGFLGVN